MPDRFVLDAFALLAFFQNEPGGRRVQGLLRDVAQNGDEVWMSVVNLGEVLYTVERRRGLRSAVEALAAIGQVPLRLADVDRPRALRAARLKASTSMGYADCFAAALARELAATLLTGDRDFSAVGGSVAIEWLPPAATSPS